jgi:hypothetical protein
MLWGFIILGILFRLRQYLFDRSLWLDESLLVLNILRRSPAQLLKPLDHLQGAPIGFLWLEKLAVHSFGPGEMALRSVPFLAGISSIFLFVMAARRLLTPGAVPIAVALFSICSPLIYYSSEVKQYSTDVAVVLILYLMSSPIFKSQLGTIRAIALSLAGGLAIWLSHPAAFVLAGIGLTSFWISIRKNEWRILLKTVLVATFWSCSFLIFYSVSLRGLSHSRNLLDYWNGAFAPFPLSSPANAKWYVDSFFGIFSYPVGLVFTGLAAVAATLGAMEIFTIDEGKCLLLVLPTALTLVASWLHRYPFQGRLLLFIVPSAILLIAAGLELISRKTRDSIPLLSPLAIGFLFLYPVANACRDFIKPQGVEEIRPVIQYVAAYGSKADILYCYYSAAPSLEYYSLRGLNIPMKEVVGVESRKNWKLYREDLDKLRGQKRVWILFSHVWSWSGVDERLLFLDYLDSIGKRLDETQETGASAYLYDLSAPQSIVVSELSFRKEAQNESSGR